MSDHTHGEYEISENQKRYFTPTTGHVRARYVRDDANFLTDWAEFDRWLAEVRADAFAQGRDSQRDYAEHMERERIIKLLEAELKLDPYSSVLRRLQAGITQDAVKGEDIE